MAEADLAGNILKQFEAAGAVRVEPGYLQSADVLLDLYGENIRARAYITHDPVHGEQMLRPDFTVPVVRRHMEARSETPREPARYTYAGPVWRRQDYGSTKAREFWQVGYEVFDGSDPSRADAEVFALIASVVSGKEVPVTGDLSFLFAAIDALETSQARKDALKRHVWRPNRFERLLKRFSGEEVFACDVGDIPELGEATHVGLRSSGEIKARLEALKIERETEDLSQDEVAFLMSVLSVKGGATACLDGFRAIGRSFPALQSATGNMQARLNALNARGIDVERLSFDASFGRASMEYYDGFVFAFGDLASGGRYDALTRILGEGSGIPAVGGVVRPALLEAGS